MKFAKSTHVRFVDGFDPATTRAFSGYDDAVAERFWQLVARASDRLHVEIDGLARVPAGRALFVMNHAFGWDAMLPIAAIRRATGRRVWALGEHLWWRLPFVRRLAAAAGTVDGTPENVDALLAADELVLVLPGGLREAVKPASLRYRLQWGARHGFVRAALRANAPLVPLAGVGADELFDFEGDAFERGRRWLGIDLPLPRPRYGLPIPHFRRWKYMIGEPIPATPLPGETAENTARRLRREVRGALEELIDDELARRAAPRSG
jgi:1-acyl-sn-glycerol-3-phosphate acyltransferase